MPYQVKSKSRLGRSTPNHMHGPYAIGAEWVNVPDEEVPALIKAGCYDVRQIKPPPPPPPVEVVAVIDEEGALKPVDEAAEKEVAKPKTNPQPAHKK